MTADHPTREERYAAVLAEHPADRGATCKCGWWGDRAVAFQPGSSIPEQHRAHVAAALVAAADCADGTSAEVSPERSSGESPAPAQCCDGTSQELSRGDVPRETPDAALSGPDVARPITPFLTVLEEHIEDLDSPGDCSCGFGLWDGTTKECRAAYRKHVFAHLRESAAAARKVNDNVRDMFLARAAQPVPAPEVSRGVAEVKAEHRWEVEYLPDPMSAGSVVRSGDLRCAECGAITPDALGGERGDGA